MFIFDWIFRQHLELFASELFKYQYICLLINNNNKYKQIILHLFWFVHILCFDVTLFSGFLFALIVLFRTIINNNSNNNSSNIFPFLWKEYHWTIYKKLYIYIFTHTYIFANVKPVCDLLWRWDVLQQGVREAVLPPSSSAVFGCSAFTSWTISDWPPHQWTISIYWLDSSWLDELSPVWASPL